MQKQQSEDEIESAKYARLMGWNEDLRQLQINTAKELGVPVRDFFKQFYEIWLASARRGIILARVA